jgi:hypothetical protein
VSPASSPAAKPGHRLPSRYPIRQLSRKRVELIRMHGVLLGYACIAGLGPAAGRGRHRRQLLIRRHQHSPPGVPVKPAGGAEPGCSRQLYAPPAVSQLNVGNRVLTQVLEGCHCLGRIIGSKFMQVDCGVVVVASNPAVHSLRSSNTFFQTASSRRRWTLFREGQHTLSCVGMALLPDT